MTGAGTSEPVVVATGRRGARYVEVTPSQSPDFVVVLTTRGQRYVVRRDSVTEGAR